MFVTLTLRALLPLGEPSPRIFRRPLTSPVACGHPRNGTIRRELIRTRGLSTSRPANAAGLSTDDSSSGCLRTPPEARAPPPFDDVAWEDPHSQSRSFTTPVKG